MRSAVRCDRRLAESHAPPHRSSPVELFTAPFFSEGIGHKYDIDPVAGRFLMIMQAGERASTAAEDHFATALRQAHTLPHKIAQPEVRRWYAWMLLDRAAPGDRERAQTLLGEAVELYGTIGMPKHVEIAEQMLHS
jgi:hypothetical protein